MAKLELAPYTRFNPEDAGTLIFHLSPEKILCLEKQPFTCFCGNLDCLLHSFTERDKELKMLKDKSGVSMISELCGYFFPTYFYLVSVKLCISICQISDVTS